MFQGDLTYVAFIHRHMFGVTGRRGSQGRFYFQLGGGLGLIYYFPGVSAATQVGIVSKGEGRRIRLAAGASISGDVFVEAEAAVGIGIFLGIVAI
jgi:hypothetical protein